MIVSSQARSVLFRPFRIRHRRLRNRIGLAPMSRLSSIAGVPRQHALDLLVHRARAGASLIYTEAILTDSESAQGYPNQSHMETPEQIDAWRPVTQAIRHAGAIAIAQIYHCGRVSDCQINPASRVIAPSAIRLDGVNRHTGRAYGMPESMSSRDIDRVVRGFAATARNCMDAGFDGLEVHAAHGYLIHQFLSAETNVRQDRYGGSVEARCRFAREIIEAVAAAISPQMLLTLRLSLTGTGQPDRCLFSSAEELVACVRLLAAPPVDALSISCRAFDESVLATGKSLPRIVRDATVLPLIVCGGIYDRDTADRALYTADVALSGKSLLLNPSWLGDVKHRRIVRPFGREDTAVAYSGELLP